MNKLFKGALATLLAVGFLAGCGTSSSQTPVETHYVTFYMDTVGGFYKEVEVEHGKTVEMPADPVKTGYTFHGWYTDTKLTAEFDPKTPIVEDLSVYADFTKDYAPDTNTYHIVGDMANTDLKYINWNATGEEGKDWDVKSYLTKAADSNLFTIELEIGYMGKFKIKQPGEPWDGGIEYDFTDIPEDKQFDYLQEGDSRNIQVKTAGKYKVELETTAETVIVTRLGDATGEGVSQDPDPSAIINWGLVGSITNWGNKDENDVVIPDIAFKHNAQGNYHYIEVYQFAVGDEFKFRADNAWTINDGYQTGMTLPAGIEAVELENDAPKPGSNLKVTKAGFYSIVITKDGDKSKFAVYEVGFALRGSALPGAWDADSEKLAFIGAEEVEGVMTYTYEGTFALTTGDNKDEFKVKQAAFGPVSGWDIAFGDGGANFKVTAAGDYKVTLKVTFDKATLKFAGVATFEAVAA